MNKRNIYSAEIRKLVLDIVTIYGQDKVIKTGKVTADTIKNIKMTFAKKVSFYSKRGRKPFQPKLEQKNNCMDQTKGLAFKKFTVK